MGNVHFPPVVVRPERPVIFLAGPIQGAPDWQQVAIDYIRSHAPDVDVASPRRPNAVKADFAEGGYYAQVEWETALLERAVKRGVVLFWGAKEADPIPGRAYAQTTRVEFGIHLVHAMYGAWLAVGVEEGFSGARYWRYQVNKKTPWINVRSSLEATCADAITLIGSVP